jgi:hypothetical protein
MAALVRGRRCPPSETPLDDPRADEAVFPRHVPAHALHQHRFTRHNLTSPCNSIFAIPDKRKDALEQFDVAL